jgi:hypothetical protein
MITAILHPEVGVGLRGAISHRTQLGREVLVKTG